jgi:murein endopeptidase
LSSSLIAAAFAVLSVGVLAQNGTDSKRLFAEWAAISAPMPGDPAAIGFYSAGCLQGGQVLPLDGTGYAIMRPSRRRFYGHPALIDYLTTLASARPGGQRRLLLIGDLGPARVEVPRCPGTRATRTASTSTSGSSLARLRQLPSSGSAWALPGSSSIESG